jgi:hypothetical protein
VGKWINKITKSEGWMAITTISRELRGLPSRLAREANLEELKDQIDIEKQIGAVPEFKAPDKKASAGSSDREAPKSEPEKSEPPSTTTKEKSE